MYRRNVPDFQLHVCMHNVYYMHIMHMHTVQLELNGNVRPRLLRFLN